MTAIFAHRGHHGIPTPRENTVEAFVAARRAGADGVELDVRATADRVLAVHHDRRVPGGAAITNLPATRLPPDVPTLGEALTACSGMRVNVEVKGGPDVAALAVAVLSAGAGRQGAGVLVSSFDARSVAAVRELAPWLPAGLLIDWATDPLSGLDLAVRLGCATLHPFVTQVDDVLASAARARGVGLHVWTVNADADIARMSRLGVEAIITDRVDDAMRILRGPGTKDAGGQRNGDGTTR